MVLQNKRDTIILFMPLAGGDAYRCVPYALLYLERVVRDLGLKIVLIDENIGTDFRPILDSYKGRILLAGVSAMLGYQIKGGMDFSMYLKDIDPHAKIVWGGWHVSMMPEQSLKEDFIDYVITGQGETPFRLLTEALLSDVEPVAIKGLLYKKEGIPINGGENDFVSADAFPDVDYTLVDLNDYILQGIPYAGRTLVYFASHGCPHNCSFCALTPVYKQRWYPKPIDKIIKEFKYFIESAHIDSICFHDDNFFTNKSFSLKLTEAMFEHKLNLKWEVWSHAGSFMKMFDNNDISLFYKYGCRRILCGAESGNNEILSLLNKKLSVEENIQFVALLKKHKITPYFTTMIAFPLNPAKDIEDTFEMIRKTKLIDLSLKVHVGYYTPFPNTVLYEYALMKGFKEPERLEEWVSHTFDRFRAPWFKPEFEAHYNIFLNFYLTLSNPFFFNNASRPLNEKLFLAVLNFLVFPFAWLRLRCNFFKWPIGAKVFFKLTAYYRKKTGKNFMIYPH